MRRVYLALPSYHSHEPENSESVHQAILPGSQTDVLIDYGCSIRSLLARQFNDFWAAAEKKNRKENLNLTHFAMMHSDVCVKNRGWLDLLIDELEKKDVDVMAAVIAVKNITGDTSTRIAEKKTRKMGPPLNLKELREMPRTFTIEDFHPIDHEKYALCVNTGLWVCKFPQPWTRKVHFEIKDWFDEVDGDLVARTLPEDWHFSLQLANLGVKVGATRVLSVDHIGRWFFGNQ